MDAVKKIDFKNSIVMGCKGKKNEIVLLSSKGEIIQFSYDHLKEEMEEYIGYIENQKKYDYIILQDVQKKITVKQTLLLEALRKDLTDPFLSDQQIISHCTHFFYLKELVIIFFQEIRTVYIFSTETNTLL
jgi:hypothetical protein